jgi:hypothetical protein
MQMPGSSRGVMKGVGAFDIAEFFKNPTGSGGAFQGVALGVGALFLIYALSRVFGGRR